MYRMISLNKYEDLVQQELEISMAAGVSMHTYTTELCIDCEVFAAPLLGIIYENKRS